MLESFINGVSSVLSVMIQIFPLGLLRATGPQQQQRGGGGRELGLPRGQEDQEEEKEPQEKGLLGNREPSQI